MKKNLLGHKSKNKNGVGELACFQSIATMFFPRHQVPVYFGALISTVDVASITCVIMESLTHSVLITLVNGYVDLVVFTCIDRKR